jgi:hypothetical protein
MINGKPNRTVASYSNWKDMKKRCFNPNNKRYKDYAERGISVHPDFVSDFSKFHLEIGEKPEGIGWSVGRIDNNGWYTYGNIRWETHAQQARNHTMQRNNTSGFTGICYREKTIAGRIYRSFNVSYNTLEGKDKTKSFSVDKFGYDQALSMAVEYRSKAIEELNLQGAGYAASHGSAK